MAADKGPSLIEVPDRSVYALMRAAADAVPLLERLSADADTEEVEANASFLASEINKALRDLRAELEPRK